MKKLVLAGICAASLMTPTAAVFSKNCDKAAATSAAAVPASSAENAPESARTKYPVFVVTDREMSIDKHGADFIGQRAPLMSYASADWTEKKDKVVGEKPVIYESSDLFMDALKKTGAHKVTVFVPGYRRDFQASLDCAADIASRLDQPVVLFAWPSKNKYSAYMTDECTAEWSAHDLADTLKMLGDKYGNQNITVIAHSVGTRIICWAYGVLAQNDQLMMPFKSTIFFSPDMDRDVFLSDASLIKRACSSVKIFLDQHDSRLWLSGKLHGGPRLGDAHDLQTVMRVFEKADFDTTLKTHRITHEMITTAFPVAVKLVPPGTGTH